MCKGCEIDVEPWMLNNSMQQTNDFDTEEFPEAANVGGSCVRTFFQHLFSKGQPGPAWIIGDHRVNKTNKEAAKDCISL